MAPVPASNAPYSFLANRGEMGALIRARDWSATPLGPMEAWPQNLKTAVNIMLASPSPVSILWGPERIQLYNDAYISIAAERHPAALGRAAAENWSEAYESFLGPVLDRVFAGETVEVDQHPVLLHSPEGRLAERFFTGSFQPVFGEAGSVEGVFHPLVEVTAKVHADVALREREERLRGVLDGMTEGFGLLAPDFTILEHNAEALRMDGRPREVIVGRSHWEVYPGSEESELGGVYKRAMADRVPVALEHCYAFENGRALWLDMRAYPTADGNLAVFWRDVTDRKEAEERLRASEARHSFLLALGDRLRRLTEPAAVTLAAAEMLGRYLGVARAGYGELDDAGELIRVERDWAERVPSLAGEARLLEGFGAAIADELRSGRTLKVDDSAIDPRASGKGVAETWASIDLRAIIAVPLIKHGRFAAFLYLHEPNPRVWLDDEVALAEEVAERTWSAVERARAEAALRVSEQDLRRSEQRLQLAKQAAGVGVWDWDLTTNEITWSPEMYELLGVDPETPADRLYAAWANSLHPDDRAAAEPIVQATAREGGSFSFDFRRTGKHGETRWIRSQAIAVAGPNGKPVRLTGVNLDVTAQHREAERLREEAVELAAVVEERTRERDRMFILSNDLFASAGFDGYLKAINPAWERLLGYTEAELLAKPFVELVHPEDLAAAADVITALRNGQPLARFEDRLIAKSGDVVWIAWAAVPEGERFYASGRDVTVEKKAAAELEAAQEALRQSQKMEAMGQLTGGVAHDFNNLLTPIVGALDLLQRKGLGGEREQRLIAGAAGSADKAKTLVQRLLAFARRQPLQPTAVDVAHLVNGMGELIASTTGPQIKVVLEVDRELPPAKADPNQLEMAVLNLAVNARDAMPDGGTLRISADVETVGRQHRSGLGPGRYIHLSVADTGLGMDEVTLARAVEPFFSTKGVGKGTGLGLSMVHGLASQLGGALVIRSTPGVGTNVELWLPQGERSQVADAAMSEEPAPPPTEGTALLVDDEDLVRLSTADMLIELGYKVIEAASAEEALRLLNQGLNPDVVVTDHLMPGVSGTDLARLLQRDRPSIKVIVISGYAEMSGITPDLPRLTKPFRNADLAAVLATIR